MHEVLLERQRKSLPGVLEAVLGSPKLEALRCGHTSRRYSWRHILCIGSGERGVKIKQIIIQIEVGLERDGF